MRRYILVLVLLLSIVTAASADKVITLKSVTLQQIDRVNMEVIASAPSAVVTYRVVDSTGATIGNQRTFSVVLTPAQKTAIVNLLNAWLPDINSAEGL